MYVCAGGRGEGACLERTWRRLTGVRCGAREACSNVSARSPSRQRQHPAPRLIALTAQQGCRCCVLGGCVSFRPPRPPDTTLMGPPATWSGTSTRASPRSLLRTSAASSAPPRTRLAARNPPRGRDRQPLKRPLRPCPALLDRAERVLCARHHSCPAGVRQSSASPRSPRAFALSRSRARARSLSRCVPSLSLSLLGYRALVLSVFLSVLCLRRDLHGAKEGNRKGKSLLRTQPRASPGSATGNGPGPGIKTLLQAGGNMTS